MNILIKDADYVYTFDPKRTVWRTADVYITGNKIAAIGKNIVIDPAGALDQIIDGRGKLVLPGLINTHHHFYQNITRNVPIMQKGSLLRWLLFSYGAWADLDQEAVRTAARLSAAELLLTGCTTSMDFMYFFPYNQHRLMDIEFDAVRELGLRFHGYRGCMPVMEGDLPNQLKQVLGIHWQPLVEKPEDILDACQQSFEKYHDPKPFAMQRVGVGPTTTVFEQPELMQELKRLANRYGGLCHTHLHPRLDELEKCQRLHGCTPHQWLEKIGWFDEKTSLAHVTLHGPEEIAILARNQVGVTHSPSCHMRLGYPVAPIPELAAAGVTVGIGVDGGSSNDSGDLLGELRTAMYVHRIQGVHPGYDFRQWFGPEEVFAMATNQGAKILNRRDIGSLEPGKAADLIMVNLQQVAYGSALADPLGALVYCGCNHLVDTNIVNGRPVVEQGRLVTASEQQIVADANRVTKRLLKAVKKRTGIDYTKAYQGANF